MWVAIRPSPAVKPIDIVKPRSACVASSYNRFDKLRRYIRKRKIYNRITGRKTTDHVYFFRRKFNVVQMALHLRPCSD